MGNPLEKVQVRVPATSANLGPGFDCLGLALDIYNTVLIEISDSFSISIVGEGSESLSRRFDNRIHQGITAVYKRVEQLVPNLRITCHNDIPLRRGLGSSAAATAAGLLGANLILGQPLPLGELLNLGAWLEGHPDNMAPALLGGCQVVARDGQEVISAQLPIPQGLEAVLFIPDFELSTKMTRRLLPHKVRQEDCVFNLSRVALLVSALTLGQLSYLRLATQDRLHQPHRQALFPAMSQIFEAALDAGALGVFLSGGGPTILALAQDKEADIARAMAEAAGRAGVGGNTKIAKPSPLGAHKVTSE